MTRRRRQELVRRRKALGHTQEDVAALVGVDRSTVVRWERALAEPQPWFCRKLASVLQVPPERLAELLDSVVELPGSGGGYTVVSSVPFDFSQVSAVGQFAEGFSAHDLASRRNVLARMSVLGGAALLKPIHQWAGLVDAVADRPAEQAPVEQLRATVRMFRSWDAAGHGGLKRKAVVGQLNAVAEAVRDTRDSMVRGERLEVLAELAQLAGWMARDQDLDGVAQRYFVLALHACREAGGSATALGAKVIADLAQVSSAQGRPDDTLRLVHSGLSVLPRSTGRSVRSVLLGHEAQACARIGERREAERSVLASLETGYQAVATEAPPDWLPHFDSEAEVDGMAASTYIRLALGTDDPARWRDYADRAEAHTLRARRARPAEFWRSRVHDEIRLAKVRLAQREPAEAVTAAHNALLLAEPLRSSLVTDSLARFADDLSARHGDHPAVREFGERLRDNPDSASIG